ncbi:MAG: transcriptional repressor [Liquorilactobacillus ghanensis]|jgi:Fur family peroxide stress response transcriptional regulator|uniref:Ferric uptake regulation protein n=1 Tax=Liquorilactobacillus ghanensis DSM 18630 TaxID=1423750 RepID=A0A0R1VHZ6_9LACO|nr:transcriptional repressor [Liquorilactobacillus ghanensis]KRM04837.1 ferric uptake regulation protein [Liquorilactobacillus ghanensis DSM 18630]
MMAEEQKPLLTAANKLREYKIKNTPQRQVILSYLMTSHEHPSIEMIFNYVRGNGFSVSLATVYNTLQLLIDHNLIIEIASDSGGHMRYDYFEEPHYHVICVNCNKIVDVFDKSYKRLETEAMEKTGYQVFNSQYEVYGLCPECQLKLRKEKADLD